MRSFAPLLLVSVLVANAAPGTTLVQSSQPSYSVTEGNTNVVIEVVLSAALRETVTLEYGTSSGTATPRQDYVEERGNLEFQPGETRKTISVQILPDNLAERDEMLTVSFWRAQQPSNIELGIPGTAIVTIHDPVAVVYLELDYEAAHYRDGRVFDLPYEREWGFLETSKHAVLRARRGGDRSSTFSVSYETVDGSARAGVDFAAVTGTLTFTAGETNQVISIPLLDDSRVNGDRQFRVKLGDVEGNARIAVDAELTVNLVDNETPVGLLDSSFAPPPHTRGLLALQPDGNLLVHDDKRIFRLNPDGSVDGSFRDESPAPLDLNWLDSGIPSLLQPDGKLVLATQDGAVRLNTNGSLDVSWAYPGGVNGTVRALARQADGRIVVGGQFTWIYGAARQYLARLNTDGTLDNTFPAGAGIGNVSFPYSVLAVAVQPDDKILIGGSFGIVDGRFQPSLARLNPDGTLDRDFAPQGGPFDLIGAMALAEDGKIYVGGGTYHSGIRVARLHADGTLDLAFTANLQFSSSAYSGDSSLITALALQADGRLLVGGFFRAVDGIPRNAFTRLLSDGRLDTSFEIGPFTLAPQFEFRNEYYLAVSRVIPQPDGRIVIGGGLVRINGIAMSGVARLFATPQATNILEFTSKRHAVAEHQAEASVTLLRHGDSSGTRTVEVAAVPRSAREEHDYHRLETRVTFAPYEVEKTVMLRLSDDEFVEADETVDLVLSQPDVGSALGYHPVTTIAILDDERPGSLDWSFDAGELPIDTYMPPWASIMAMSLLTDGSIVASGHIGLTKFRPDGSRDPAFIDGQVDGHELAVQPGGSIVSGWGHLTRFHPDGRVDPIFVGGGGPDFLVPLPDGKLIIGSTGEIVRLLPDGPLDPAFGAAPEVAESARAVAVQPDGKIVVLGAASLSRLNADGTRDPTFRVTPLVNDDTVRVSRSAVAVAPDGKIVVAGNLVVESPVRRKHVMRFLSDGSIDPSFDVGSGVAQGGLPIGMGRSGKFSLAVRSDGKVLVGGWFSSWDGEPVRHLLRLNRDGSRDRTFDVGESISGAYEHLWRIVLQPDGQILICGSFLEFNGIPRLGIARLNGDRHVLRLEAAMSPGGAGLQLRFNSLAGRSYAIETSTNLTTWTLLREVPSTGAVTEFTDVEVSKPAMRYYRVRGVTVP